MYSINFKQDKQDSINFHDFSGRQDWEREFGSWFNFDEILKDSIRRGEVANEEEIECFCDGSNNINPYFSSNSAEYEAQTLLEESEGIEFDPEVTEYDAY